MTERETIAKALRVMADLFQHHEQRAWDRDDVAGVLRACADIAKPSDASKSEAA